MKIGIRRRIGLGLRRLRLRPVHLAVGVAAPILGGAKRQDSDGIAEEKQIFRECLYGVQERERVLGCLDLGFVGRDDGIESPADPFGSLYPCFLSIFESCES